MIVNLGATTLDQADSYGRIANELSAELTRMGYHVNQHVLDDDTPRLLRPAMGGILLGYPTLHHEFGQMVNAGPRVAVTAFESTKIPGEWVEPLNACHAIIVPAPFLIEVMQNAGVTTPVYAIPQAVSETFINATRRSRCNPFTFLVIGDRGRRKGWDVAVSAFHRAFGDDERYKLIIKARRFPLNFAHPNIEIIREDYTDAQMADLYSRCHVLAFSSRGEGYGLPAREFAATGGVVLATNWGGTAFEIERWGVPIPYRMSDAWKDHKEWSGQMGQWAEPDGDALTYLMKHVADHYDVYHSQSLINAGYVGSHLRWSQYTQKVADVWQSVLEEAYGNGKRNNDATQRATG